MESVLAVVRQSVALLKPLGVTLTLPQTPRSSFQSQEGPRLRSLSFFDIVYIDYLSNRSCFTEWCFGWMSAHEMSSNMLTQCPVCKDSPDEIGIDCIYVGCSRSKLKDRSDLFSVSSLFQTNAVNKSLAYVSSSSMPNCCRHVPRPSQPPKRQGAFLLRRNQNLLIGEQPDR